MEHGTPDGDPTEGPDVSEATTCDCGQTHEPPDVSRVVRWRRVITITGPQDWVDSTRANSLTQGLHNVGIKDGVPCVIEVEAEEADHLRFLHSPTPNKAMADMRRDHPERYEAVHGPGTAIEHRDHSEIVEANQAASPPTPTTDQAPGLYL